MRIQKSQVKALTLLHPHPPPQQHLFEKVQYGIS